MVHHGEIPVSIMPAVSSRSKMKQADMLAKKLLRKSVPLESALKHRKHENLHAVGSRYPTLFAYALKGRRIDTITYRLGSDLDIPDLFLALTEGMLHGETSGADLRELDEIFQTSGKPQSYFNRLFTRRHGVTYEFAKRKLKDIENHS